MTYSFGPDEQSIAYTQILNFRETTPFEPSVDADGAERGGLETGKVGVLARSSPDGWSDRRWGRAIWGRMAVPR